MKRFLSIDVPLKMRSLVCFLVLLLMAMGTRGVAQTTQGSVFGTVRDASGAAIAGASVTLTNVDEGVSRTATTNAGGNYVFLDAVAAHYTVKVDAPGFESFEASRVALVVRQQLRVDATLRVGAVKQQVVVNGDTVSDIQTDSPTVSGAFTASDAEDLPVNTRASASGTSAAAILGVLPGAQDDQSGVSIQGALPFETDVTIDGITVKNAQGGTWINDAFPSTEAISEIRVDGVLAGAEYGDPGQVVVTTKSGTNHFHGSAFTYYQDNNWNAHAYSYTPYTQPSYHGTTFGGSLGGPVILPHYDGHDRSFFFGDYEGWRFPSQAVLQEVVPTQGMMQGDFSGYTDAQGHAITLRDPYDPTQMWGTKIPSGMISPIAAATLKQFYPTPNIGNPNTYQDGETANWTENVDASKHSDQFDIRGDQYFGSNQKFLLWGKFTWKNFPTISPELLNVPSSTQINTNKVLRVDTNWTITPNLINEGGYGFTRVWGGTSNPFNGTAWTQGENFQGLQNLFFNGIPEMDFQDLQSLTADRLTSLNNSITNVYQDTLLWTRGSHIFKFGGTVSTLGARTPLGFFGADNYGTYAFDLCGTNGSSGCFTGIDFADFLLGIPNGTEYDVVQQDNNGYSVDYEAFAQDEWRANDRLTISYGIRYELHPAYYDKGGDIGNFSPFVPGSGAVVYMDGYQKLLARNYLASANACDPDGVTNTNNATVNGVGCMPVETNSKAGLPKGLRQYPHKRFMPRFGLAYRPFGDDKTAIRAGFGMYDIRLLGSNFYSLTGTIQAATQSYTNALNCTGPNTCAPTYQWPEVYSGSGNGGPTNAYGTDYFGTANSVNWKDPYTYQWNLSVDRYLGQGYALRVSYIGSESHQLVWAPDENTLPFSNTVSAYNQPFTARLFPNWGRINTRATGANDSYNSLQVEASHRLQQGLEFDSTFTWAKNLADNQGPNNGGFAGESGGSRATSILDRAVDFGDVYGTRRLLWNTTGLYQLPIGRGKTFGGNMSRLADSIVGGWEVSTIFTAETGDYLMPYFPAGDGDPSGTGSGLSSSLAGWDPSHRTQYADTVVGANWRSGARTRTLWANPSAFTCPGDSSWKPGFGCYTGAGYNANGTPRYTGPGAASPRPIGRFGNARNGSIEGPGLVNLSAGIDKVFAVTAQTHFRIEGTFTNVLNHTNLGDPVMNLSLPTFGLIEGTNSGYFSGGRTIQVAARFEF